jgi:hypothetical protein
MCPIQYQSLLVLLNPSETQFEKSGDIPVSIFRAYHSVNSVLHQTVLIKRFLCLVVSLRWTLTLVIWNEPLVSLHYLDWGKRR